MSDENANNETNPEEDVTPEEGGAPKEEAKSAEETTPKEETAPAEEASPKEGATPEEGAADEEEMTDAERQMQEMLDSEEADQPAQPIRPVDMDEVKTVPKGKADNEANLKLILDIPVEVKVEVGNARITISEILNLAPGAIVELDRTAGSPADVIVNGTKVGHGDVVVVDESYGIRLTKLIAPQDRIDSL